MSDLTPEELIDYSLHNTSTNDRVLLLPGRSALLSANNKHVGRCVLREREEEVIETVWKLLKGRRNRERGVKTFIPWHAIKLPLVTVYGNCYHKLSNLYNHALKCKKFALLLNADGSMKLSQQCTIYYTLLYNTSILYLLLLHVPCGDQHLHMSIREAALQLCIRVESPSRRRARL